jgi:hypothetical protein
MKVNPKKFKVLALCSFGALESKFPLEGKDTSQQLYIDKLVNYKIMINLHLYSPIS